MHIQIDVRTIPKVSRQIDVFGKPLVWLDSFWNYKIFDHGKCYIQETICKFLPNFEKKNILAVAMGTEEAK